MIYLLAAICAFSLSVLGTFLVRRLAWRFKILDQPDGGRKIHRRATPLLGGTAIYLALAITFLIFHQYLLVGDLTAAHWVGFLIGGAILMIGGFLDDKYNLQPWQQLFFPFLAVAAVLLGGVEIARLSDFQGGIVNLSDWPWLSPLLISLWLLGMMYTTKLLDGVDGLVSGVSLIGALVIFLFTLTTNYYQPDIALASLILVAATAGFLIFNFNPASIFLGEGGSLFLGFSLGVLSIISGSKIAIALLIMGLPIIDVAWTIARRLVAGKNPFRSPDKKHFHHRLLAAGLNQKQTVFVFYILAATFGVAGLFLQSRGKLLALLGLVAVIFLLVIFLPRLIKKGKPRLLLHICCAPCSAYIIKTLLKPVYKVVLYFDNSNLNTKEEYEVRLAAVKQMAGLYRLKLIVAPYEPEPWHEAVKGLESEPERGKRCAVCYRRRLESAAVVAKQENCEYFSSSLLVSPYKDRALLKKLGAEIAEISGLKFLEEDFSAPDIYPQSQTLAKDLGFYRQKFCGCEFSKR
jgi:UDP-GlcNAc:undecaprenyl-phosphate GlcNAc-1-phosphate transferase